MGSGGHGCWGTPPFGHNMSTVDPTLSVLWSGFPSRPGALFHTNTVKYRPCWPNWWIVQIHGCRQEPSVDMPEELTDLHNDIVRHMEDIHMVWEGQFRLYFAYNCSTVQLN